MLRTLIVCIGNMNTPSEKQYEIEISFCHEVSVAEPIICSEFQYKRQTGAYTMFSSQ